MEIIYFLAELIPCLIIGYWIGRLKENISRIIACPLINYGIPIGLMGILLQSGLELPLIQSAVIAIVAVSLLMAILNCLPLFNKRIPNQTLKLGSVFGNTGYFGIPVSLALLPSQALIYSIGFDLGATFWIWGIGPILLKDSSKNLHYSNYYKTFIKAISKSPAIKGLIGAVIIQLSPWNEQITSILWIPSRLVMVLALVIVGMSLAWLRKSNLSRINNQLLYIKNALIFKLIGLPFVMLIIGKISNMPIIMRNALVLQAAAPTAISVLLISQAASRDETKTTLLVIISTLSALITIPIWSIILRL